jgi:two-component system response regulator FixJ
MNFRVKQNLINQPFFMYKVSYPISPGTRKIVEKAMEQSQAIVYVVDDDSSVREFLRILLRSVELSVKTCSSAAEFLTLYNPDLPGCLLLDVHMPGMTGLQLQELLKTKQLELPIIIITGNADVKIAVEAMKAGALDFIEKPFDNKILLERVHECLNISRNLHENHLQRAEATARLSVLTQREREVMALLVEGKLNKVIAADLGISPRTVEIHRAKLMEKLQAKSLSDVIKIAFLTH